MTINENYDTIVSSLYRIVHAILKWQRIGQIIWLHFISLGSTQPLLQWVRSNSRQYSGRAVAFTTHPIQCWCERKSKAILSMLHGMLCCTLLLLFRFTYYLLSLEYALGIPFARPNNLYKSKSSKTTSNPHIAEIVFSGFFYNLQRYSTKANIKMCALVSLMSRAADFTKFHK